jgi:hypothetical protein
MDKVIDVVEHGRIRHRNPKDDSHGMVDTVGHVTAPA